MIRSDAQATAQTDCLHELLSSLLQMKRRESVRRISDQPLRGVELEIDVVEIRDNYPDIRLRWITRHERVRR